MNVLIDNKRQCTENYQERCVLFGSDDVWTKVVKGV
jgi:hypothetical protein